MKTDNRGAGHACACPAARGVPLAAAAVSLRERLQPCRGGGAKKKGRFRGGRQGSMGVIGACGGLLAAAGGLRAAGPAASGAGGVGRGYKRPGWPARLPGLPTAASLYCCCGLGWVLCVGAAARGAAAGLGWAGGF